MIFKVRLSSSIADGEWKRAGVKLLGYESDTVVVLFSDDAELQFFRARIYADTGGVPKDPKKESYAQFLDSIDSIEAIAPRDRIGAGFRDRETNGQIAIVRQAEYLVDLEVWRPEDGMAFSLQWRNKFLNARSILRNAERVASTPYFARFGSSA